MPADSAIPAQVKASEGFARLRPMLASHSAMPSQVRQFGFEPRWSGVRALVFYDGEMVRLADAIGRDIGAAFPELFDLRRVLRGKAAILDGIITSQSTTSEPDDDFLQRRLGVRRPNLAVLEQTPIVYIAFDLLFVGGRWIMHWPFQKRHARLQRLGLSGIFWRTSQRMRPGPGMICEGLVAKRLDSVYQPGRQSADWLEIKPDGAKENSAIDA
jgi:bifunctional non-homologous end joining protein LigD